MTAVHAMIVRLAKLAAVLLLLLSVTTLFDRLHPLLEMFSHFRLQYFAAGIGLLTVLALYRQFSFAVAMLALSAVNGWPLLPWWLADENSDRPGVDLVVLHANVQYSNTDTEPFLKLARDSDADIVIVQEFTPRWLAVSEQLRDRYPHQITEPREHPFGIALLSKLPFESSALLENDDRPSVLVEILKDASRVSLLAAHPPPPLGQALTQARDEQLRSIAALAESSTDPFVVIGDLNVSMWSHKYRAMETIGGLRNARKGRGVLPTWPQFFRLAAIPIDHCLVSEEIAVRDFSLGPDIGSDHLPIVARLALPLRD